MESTALANQLGTLTENDNGGFDFKIRNLGLNFLFKYDMLSTPEYVNDSGIGRAIFDDLTVNLDFTLFLNHNHIEAHVDQVNISVSELNLILQGGDFSQYMNQFMGQMRDYLEAKIHEQLQWMVNQGSQVILNQLLTEIQDSLYFQYSDIRMNNLLR